MKAIEEIGFSGIYRYLLSLIFEFFYVFMFLPPLRVFYLRLWGAKIGENVVFYKARFMNLYRGSLKNLIIGDDCFIGSEVLLDLADKLILEDQVTIADRAAILTHFNVGFKDHPLQKIYTGFTKSTIIKGGSFVGLGSIVLPGVVVGDRSFIAAGSVVTKDAQAGFLVGGVPAKKIKKL